MTSTLFQKIESSGQIPVTPIVGQSHSLLPFTVVNGQEQVCVSAKLYPQQFTFLW
jgi:hypothetical protein